MVNTISIVGTGLIGASVGLALRGAGFEGEIVGIDQNPKEISTAVAMGAVTRSGSFEDALGSDVVVLATPVFGILDCMQRLAPLLGDHQLITDVGSTKLAVVTLAQTLRQSGSTARILPGHPMAGKESSGAALAEAKLLDGATWLFTPFEIASTIEGEWREWVRRFGCRTLDLDAARHDQICAWVSHLPQMVATAMAAMLQDEIGGAPGSAAEFCAIGGRALREMTRLGASPYSMWRDVAMTNTKPLAAALFAFEQRLAHLRENLKTPELRDEFGKANAFRREP